MSNHSNHIPHDLIEDAVLHAFDPHRSDTENMSGMSDYLSQFTGPLSREQQIGVELDLADEIRRRKSFNPFDIHD